MFVCSWHYTVKGCNTIQGFWLYEAIAASNLFLQKLLLPTAGIPQQDVAVHHFSV